MKLASGEFTNYRTLVGLLWIGQHSTSASCNLLFWLVSGFLLFIRKWRDLDLNLKQGII